MRAWIGLGGNREDSADLVARALSRLGSEQGVRLLRRSGLYRSAPWGRAGQPDFVNAVAELETSLQPEVLLRLLLATERELGRSRDGTRWGPRCIDLDLLTYGEMRLQSDELVLPHPRMSVRAFVLVPLMELEPEFVIPGVGPAADCLDAIDPAEIAGVSPRPPLLKEYEP